MGMRGSVGLYRRMVNGFPSIDLSVLTARQRECYKRHIATLVNAWREQVGEPVVGRES